MKNFFTILFLLFIISCSHKEQNNRCRTVTMEGLTEHQLDEHIGKLFSNKKTIILDDSSEVCQGRIIKVLCRNDQLFILSRASKKEQLLAFDMNGKFLFKVGMHGRANNEYLSIEGFDIDKNGDIYVNDILGKKILKFDNQGIFKETVEAPYSEIYGMKRIDKDQFLFCLAQWTSAEPKSELLKYNFAQKTDSVYTLYGKYVDDNYLITSPDFTVANGNVFFLNNMNDTLYQTNSKGELTDKIYFDFGSRNVPPKDKADLELKIEQQGIYEKYTALATFCCEDEKYIYGGLFDAGTYRFFILDEPNKTIYKSQPESFPAFGNILGFDDKYLITQLDYVSYKHNPNAFDATVSAALQSDKVAICLYNN